jgi:hypothetical protein
MVVSNSCDLNDRHFLFPEGRSFHVARERLYMSHSDEFTALNRTLDCQRVMSCAPGSED